MKLTLTTLALFLYSILSAQNIEEHYEDVDKKQVEAESGNGNVYKAVPYRVVGIASNGGPVVYDLSEYSKVKGQDVKIGFITTKSYGYIMATRTEKLNETREIFMHKVSENGNLVESPQKIASGNQSENDAAGLFISDDRTKFAYLFTRNRKAEEAGDLHKICAFNENCELLWEKQFNLKINPTQGYINQVTVTNQGKVLLSANEPREGNFNKKTESNLHEYIYIYSNYSPVRAELTLSPGNTPSIYKIHAIDETSAVIVGMYTSTIYKNTLDVIGSFTCKLDLISGKITSIKYFPFIETNHKTLKKYHHSKAIYTSVSDLYYLTFLSLEKSTAGTYLAVFETDRFIILLPVDKDYNLKSELLLKIGSHKETLNLGDKLAFVCADPENKKSNVLFFDFDGNKITEKQLSIPEKAEIKSADRLSDNAISLNLFIGKIGPDYMQKVGVIEIRP